VNFTSFVGDPGLVSSGKYALTSSGLRLSTTIYLLSASKNFEVLDSVTFNYRCDTILLAVNSTCALAVCLPVMVDGTLTIHILEINEFGNKISLKGSYLSNFPVEQPSLEGAPYITEEGDLYIFSGNNFIVRNATSIYSFNINTGIFSTFYVGIGTIVGGYDIESFQVLPDGSVVLTCYNEGYQLVKVTPKGVVFTLAGPYYMVGRFPNSFNGFAIEYPSSTYSMIQSFNFDIMEQLNSFKLPVPANQFKFQLTKTYLLLLGSVTLPMLSMTPYSNGELQPNSLWYQFFADFFCADDYYIYGGFYSIEGDTGFIARYPYN